MRGGDRVAPSEGFIGTAAPILKEEPADDAEMPENGEAPAVAGGRLVSSF